MNSIEDDWDLDEAFPESVGQVYLDQCRADEARARFYGRLGAIAFVLVLFGGYILLNHPG